MHSTTWRGFLAFGIRLLLLCGLGAAAGHVPDVMAAETTAAAVTERTRFGTVIRIRGEVTASPGETGPRRTLSEGDAVYVGENVRAGPSAEAVIRTGDAGLMAVRPGASFLVEGFSATGGAGDNFAVRLITGGLRVLTGWIGRTNRPGHRILTATATIGVRGTDHEPYVMSADLARTMPQNEGTYDKVNRGGTTMDVNGNTLDIDPGRVGFARAARRERTRGLLTILLPVLLDTVPDFYVPGQFDAELDRLAETLDAESQRALEMQLQNAPPAPAPVPSASSAATKPAAAAAPPATAPTPFLPQAPAVAGDCNASTVATAWLAAFDGAVVRRDTLAIVRLFAPDVTVRANVRGSGGAMSSVDLGRDELHRSTVAAMQGLTDYQQRRPSTEARIVEAPAGVCRRVSIRSVAIEQGRQGGQPYRFEALEEYLLELRNGEWLAIRAATTQR